MLMLAPDGAGSGSTEGGTPAPANVEDSLTRAFGADTAGAGAGKPAAKPDTGDKAAGGTSSADVKMAAWADQLPQEIRDNPEMAARLAKFAKVGDMAKAFIELEGSTASQQADKPKAAQDYAFAKDAEHEGAAFADAAFAANLTKTQAEALFKSLGEIGGRRAQAIELAQEQQRKETAAALAAEYGSKYGEKMELLTRGLAAAGPNIGKLLSQAGLAGNPEIVKAFIAFGQMTAESGAAKGSGVGEPIKSVFEGGSFEFKT